MRFLRDNGLTIVLASAWLTTIVGMFLTGWQVYNQELIEHGAPSLAWPTYALSGHFLSVLFENWESEFLQMSAYVVLTAFLFQRGSAESKDPDEVASQDEDPAIWAFRKALAWRVSMQMTGSPASTIPLNSHCESGPASRPIRTSGKAGSFNIRIRSSGWLGTFSSRITFPVSSRMHTEVSFRETSKPA